MRFEIQRICRCLCDEETCHGCKKSFPICKMMSLYEFGNLVGKKRWVCGQQCLYNVRKEDLNFVPLGD